MPFGPNMAAVTRVRPVTSSGGTASPEIVASIWTYDDDAPRWFTALTRK
jgi:hypothetical protein